MVRETVTEYATIEVTRERVLCDTCGREVPTADPDSRPFAVLIDPRTTPGGKRLLTEAALEICPRCAETLFEVDVRSGEPTLVDPEAYRPIHASERRSSGLPVVSLPRRFANWVTTRPRGEAIDLAVAGAFAFVLGLIALTGDGLLAITVVFSLLAIGSCLPAAVHLSRSFGPPGH